MDLYRLTWILPHGNALFDEQNVKRKIYAKMQKKTENHVNCDNERLHGTHRFIYQFSFSHMTIQYVAFYCHKRTNATHTYNHIQFAQSWLCFCCHTKTTKTNKTLNRPNIKQALWIMRMRWEWCTHSRTTVCVSARICWFVCHSLSSTFVLKTT